MAAWQLKTTREREVELAAKMPLREQQPGDDAHSLLGVIAAVAKLNRRAAETSCNRRKVPSTARGVARTNSQETLSTSNNASKNPVIGDSTMAALVVSTLHTTASAPALGALPLRPDV